jgi:hypothetical protein
MIANILASGLAFLERLSSVLICDRDQKCSGVR